MSPSAEQASSAIAAQAIVPEGLLGGGEVVILAVKPSGWFVLLASAPVLGLAGIIAMLVFLASAMFGASPAYDIIYLLCLAAACVRIIMAFFQWMGRLYVLTNRRLLTIHGVVRTSVSQCLLKCVRQVVLRVSFGEKLLGLGSLGFNIGEEKPCDISIAGWSNLARAEEIRQVICQAIGRTK